MTTPPTPIRSTGPSIAQLRLLRAVAEGQVAHDDRGWHISGVPVDHELAVLERAGAVTFLGDMAVPTSQVVSLDTRRTGGARPDTATAV